VATKLVSLIDIELGGGNKTIVKVLCIICATFEVSNAVELILHC